MQNVIIILYSLLPFLYFLPTLFYGIFFFKKNVFPEKLRLLILLVVFVHILCLTLHTIEFNQFPSSSLFEILTLLSLSIVLIYFFIEQKTGYKSTGFCILIFAFLFQLFSTIFILIPPKNIPVLHSSAVIIHITSALIGYASFIIAAIYSILYLMLSYHIKSKRLGLIYDRLPPLEILDDMNYKASCVGVFFLSISIVSGVIALPLIIKDVKWQTDFKTISVFFIWLIFTISILSKKYFGWSGKRMAILSFCGFLLLLFSLFIVNLLLTKFHLF